MDYSEIYVKRIRQLCKERGIAINKLASMSDVKQSTLDNIVRGLTKNPRIKTLHKIALAFNMTVAEFLDFKELNDFSFEDNDAEWRKKYRDRFFNGGTDKDEDEEDFHSQPVKPKTFSDLFTVKE